MKNKNNDVSTQMRHFWFSSIFGIQVAKLLTLLSCFKTHINDQMHTHIRARHQAQLNNFSGKKLL